MSIAPGVFVSWTGKINTLRNINLRLRTHASKEAERSLVLRMPQDHILGCRKALVITDSAL